MSKKALRTKQKYQDLRQKMKAKKAKRRQRLGRKILRSLKVSNNNGVVDKFEEGRPVSTPACFGYGRKSNSSSIEK